MKKIILFLCLISAAFCNERKKQVDLVHDLPIDPNDQSLLQTPLLKNIYETLKEKNVTLHVTDLQKEKDTDELTYIVFWNKRDSLTSSVINRFSPKKRLLFLWDAPVVQKELYRKSFLDSFKRVYTWKDDLVDNKKFFKLYYPALKPMLKDLPSYEDKKLLTQISSNKHSDHSKELYKKREKVIAFFEDKPREEFDFYGRGWDQKGYKNYGGALDNKLETMKNYRFAVCYENMHDAPGYITEKIFDCFAAGTIPIYWGASNVADYIPKNCFIDRRDFHDFTEVYDYIKALDKTAYDTYLQNIRDYLESDKAKLFSQEMFNVIFLEAVRFP